MTTVNKIHSELGTFDIEDSYIRDKFIPSKNIFDLTAVIKDYQMLVNNTGDNIEYFKDSTSNYLLSDYIKIEPSTSYAISHTPSPSNFEGAKQTITASDLRWAIFDQYKNYLSTDNSGTYDKAKDIFTSIISVPASAAYMRISFKNDSKNIQIEKGTKSTEYAPYRTVLDKQYNTIYNDIIINNDNIIFGNKVLSLNQDGTVTWRLLR